MLINKKIFLSRTIVLIFLILICLVTIKFETLKYVQLDVILSFLIIDFTIIISIVRCAGKGPTLELMFWIFNFLFNFIAPLSQIANDSFPFKVNINYNNVFKTNLLLILSYFIFYITMYFLKKKKNIYNDNKKETINDKRIININKNFMIITTFICTIICIYYILTYGIGNLLFRATAKTIYGNNQIQFLIKNTIYPSFMSCSVVFAIIFYRKKKTFARLVLTLYLFFILCVTFSPLALSRFQAAVLYGSILIYSFKSFMEGSKFLYTFLIAMFIIFPILGLFRNMEVIEKPTIIIDTLENLDKEFIGGDYDAYSTIPLILQYTDDHGITYGRQLLGVVLFYVPRSMWANKPIGSGATVAKSLNREFTNVSCQYLAEGYINFGIIGIILFTIFISVVIKKFDSYIFEIKKTNTDADIILLLYDYFLFLLFIILRGDLMSSFSFTIGVFIVIIVMTYICNKLNKKTSLQHKKENT